jgi:basic amino acid/polyamine antiporter, APA family
MSVSTPTTGRPTLFLRNATGLVKAWSGFDAFIYSFMSVSLVSLGFGAFGFVSFVAGGHILSAILFTGVFVTFLVITYALLVTAMPRAGGDYTWQSRILGGGAAFVLSMTGWWFILWHWTPIYAGILNQQVLAPLFSTIGRQDIGVLLPGSLVPNGGSGLFIACLIVLAFVCVYVTLGMETYARIQKFCFYLGLAGLAVMAIILLFSSGDAMHQAINREAASLFGYTGKDAYQATIDLATKNGYSPSSFNAFSLGPTLAIVPFLLFYLLWPVWGATLYGEVRGTKDYRRIFNSMFWGLWATVILSVVVLLLMAKTIGWQFFEAASYNNSLGLANQPIPIWPHPVMLAGWLVNSHFFQFILLAVMSVWFWGWSGTLFLSSTRVIFAAAFDRVLPEWAANISAKRRVPYGALILMVVPSIVVSAIYAYVNGFETLVLDATLVIAITYLGTVVGAAILPWRRATIFNNSPIAKVRVAGVPAITVAAVITGLFLIFNLWKWFTDTTYGLNNVASFRYLAILYVAALVVYVGFFLYRRSQGIDLRAIHREIPVE